MDSLALGLGLGAGLASAAQSRQDNSGGGVTAAAGTYVLRGRSTGGAAVRLTTDGNAASASNTANIPLNTVWSGLLNVAARDVATGDAGAWAYAHADMQRKATTSVTPAIGTPVFTSTFAGTSGLVTGALVVAGDNATSGLSIIFTPPNSDTWDVVAVFRTAEVS